MHDNPKLQQLLERYDTGERQLGRVSLTGIDLKEVDLKRASLVGSDFRQSNLSQANLKQANLSQANFKQANLSQANLEFTDFSRAMLDDADLTEAKLSGANLFNAQLRNAKLIKADLRAAKLNTAQLIQADLTETYLHEADLSQARLSKAVLQGADLSECELWETNFNEANLEKANLARANLKRSQFNKANLRGVNFSECNLSEIQFQEADLSGVNLSGLNLKKTNFTSANLSQTDLSEADLRNASLNGVNLQGANLSGVDFSGLDFNNLDLSKANLTNVNLTGVQALRTNFEEATLTGACIEDWHINSATNLNKVICDYIYLKANQQERRPSDPNQNFAPGDFSRLFQKAIETVDLIFRNGIDWQAFSTSLQALKDEQLKIEGSNQSFPIRAIETRDDGTFVVRINVPPQVDKAEIEASFKNKYQKALKAKEQVYRRELQAKDEQIAIYRQHNASLEKIVDTLASRPIEINNNNMANSESKGDTLSGNFGIGKMTGGEIKNGAKVAGILNEAQPEIIQLIELLRRNIQTLNEPTIRDEAVEYLNDLETEVKQPEPKKSRLKAALLALWNLGKDVTLLANGITALAERFGISLPHLPPS